MSEVFELFEVFGKGPIDAETIATVIATVQDRLDLLTVLRVRYGCELEVNGERWKTACFLPSAVDGFAGACAEQDASKGGAVPKNLSIQEGDNTRVWRCFSCGRHGDVIDLIEYADGLRRTLGHVVGLSAIRAAAKLVGVTYLLDSRAPDERDDPSDLVSLDSPRKIVRPPKPVVAFKRARAINARAAKHWHKMLNVGPGYLACAELARRGVTPAQCKRFVLGFAAAKWRELVELLPKGARGEAEILGLIGRSQKGEYYDRYRDRLMFPYCEPARDGRPQAVTGFAGRSLTRNPDAPKWFNSRNVDGVWRKSAALLGLLQACETLKRTGAKRAAVGEGGWEVLAFDRIDVACVGLVAAPMTLDHAHLLATVLGVEEVTIAGDGDETGRRGVATSAISLLQYGYAVATITVIDPPDDEDTGQWGETSEGLERLREAWKHPQTLESFLLSRGDMLREQQKRKLVNVLPRELAQSFARLWSVPYDEDDAEQADALSPAALFVSELARDPSLASQLDGALVPKVLAGSVLALRELASFDFGTETHSEALPAKLRGAWLSLFADYGTQALAVHTKLDKFAGSKSGAENFKAWYAAQEYLRASVKKALRELAKLRA